MNQKTNKTLMVDIGVVPNFKYKMTWWRWFFQDWTCQ